MGTTIYVLCNVHCMQASDSTHLEWSAGGEHVLTATTAPRLREGNGLVEG